MKINDSQMYYETILSYNCPNCRSFFDLKENFPLTSICQHFLCLKCFNEIYSLQNSKCYNCYKCDSIIDKWIPSKLLYSALKKKRNKTMMMLKT